DCDARQPVRDRRRTAVRVLGDLNSSTNGARALSTSSPPLRRSQLLAFALPAMPLAAFHSPITVYLPPFFGTEMGLGLATVGAIFMLARVWDIITDPVLGILTDKLPSRWGR